MDGPAWWGILYVSLVGCVHSTRVLWDRYVAIRPLGQFGNRMGGRHAHPRKAAAWYSHLFAGSMLFLVCIALVVKSAGYVLPVFGVGALRGPPPRCFVTNGGLSGIPPTRLAIDGDHPNRSIIGADLADLPITDSELRAMLRQAPEIEFLIVTNTDVTDGAVRAVNRAPRLAHVTLAGTAITDAGLAQLSSMKELEYLLLVGTSTTDEGLKHLSCLPRLKDLQLQGALITDVGLIALDTMSQLKCLNVANTGDTRIGVEQLVNSLPKLRDVAYGDHGP